MRSTLFDESEPRFAGRIAYRTTYPARLLDGFDMGDCTKWWGEDRHIVMYPVKSDRSEVYFVTSQPEPEFGLKSWSEKGDVKVLRAAFEGFHPDVQRVLAACPEVHKRVLVDREPLERWVDGNVVLLGDACHPMTPYMAQGAAMAIEDAAILSRCLAEPIATAWPTRSPLRGDAKGTDGAGATDLAPEQLGQGGDGYRLGLRLQRVDGAPRRRSAGAARKDRPAAGPLGIVTGGGLVRTGARFRSGRRVAGKFLEGKGRIGLVRASGGNTCKRRKDQQYKRPHVGLHQGTRISRVSAVPVKHLIPGMSETAFHTCVLLPPV